MIHDIMALARDVDRLFRARQDGRQMPVGTRKPGFREPWVADAREWNAYLLGLGVAWCKPYGIDAATKKAFRTREHVAMLALKEPDHFKACLADINCHWEWVIDDSDVSGPQRQFGRRCGLRYNLNGTTFYAVRPYVYPDAKLAADVARTARYLQDLDARLTEWREAEAVRAAIEARDKEIAEQDALAAAAQEPIPQEDEDAIMAMA